MKHFNALTSHSSFQQEAALQQEGRDRWHTTTVWTALTASTPLECCIGGSGCARRRSATEIMEELVRGSNRSNDSLVLAWALHADDRRVTYIQCDPTNPPHTGRANAFAAQRRQQLILSSQICMFGGPIDCMLQRAVLRAEAPRTRTYYSSQAGMH